MSVWLRHSKVALSSLAKAAFAGVKTVYPVLGASMLRVVTRSAAISNHKKVVLKTGY